MARLGLGLAALGRPGYMTVGHASDIVSDDPEAMQQQAFAVLDAAHAAGIRHFDTARSYGKAEEFVAGWIKARGRTDVKVSSKWGYRYTAEWKKSAPVHEVKELTLDTLEKQWAESRAILGPALRVYQIHSVTLESGVLDDVAVMRRLEQLKSKEKVEIGLTVTGPQSAEVIRKALTFKIFTWVQATWNVLERSAEEALASANEHGVNVIIKEVMANGRLASRGDVPGILELARRKNLTPDVVALGTALAQPWAKVVLLGAATVEQLKSNVRSEPFESKDIAGLREPPEVYWEKRSQLEWT